MRKILTASLVTLLATLSVGCDTDDNPASSISGFTLSRESIVESQSKMRGTIYKEIGADGPYREEGTVTATYGDAGNVEAGSGAGRISESWPATPNYFYEGTAYTNAGKEGYIVIRKVSKMEAEQAALTGHH